jgi:hypothetical protein
MKYVYGIAAYQKYRNKKLECVFCYRLPVDTRPNIRIKDCIDIGMKCIEFDKKEIIPDTVEFLDVPKADDVYLEIVRFEPPFSKYESVFYKITDYNAFVEYGDTNWKYYGYSSKYVLQTIDRLGPESKEVIRKMEERLANRVHKIIIPDVNEEEKEMTDYRTISTTKITAKAINTKLNLPVSFIPIPIIAKIVFNNPATIVFWEDGTKTVVKCMEGQEFNEYYGVACAIMKRFFGNNSKASAFVEKFKEEEE